MNKNEVDYIEVTEEVLLNKFDGLIKRHKETMGADEKLDLIMEVVCLIFIYFRYKVGNDLLFSIERENR